MKKYINQFWSWYEDNLHLNIGIAAGLFVWQLAHLICPSGLPGPR